MDQSRPGRREGQTSSDNLVVKLLIANNFPNLLIVTSDRKKPSDLQRRQPTKKTANYQDPKNLNLKS